MTDSQFVHNIMGQGRVNQLGGTYINGRPLPRCIRERIVEMSKKHIKPCEISRQLKVSHGAVSKILNRYAETGSINPGQIGGNPRQRLSIQNVEKQIALLKDERSDITAPEIQQLLISHGVCTQTNVPTISSINRHLKARGFVMKRSYERQQPSPIAPTTTGLWIDAEPQTPISNNKQLKFSVDNILNIVGQKSNALHQQSSFSDGQSESESSTPASRSRTYFTPEQVEYLEKSYDKNPYPDPHEKEQIANKTGLNENKVQVWFSNRRARQRKNLTNNTVFTAEQLLRSAAIQQHNQTTNSTPQNNQYPSFQFPPPPVSILNYLQQPQQMHFFQLFAALQQQQSAKYIP